MKISYLILLLLIVIAPAGRVHAEENYAAITGERASKSVGLLVGQIPKTQVEAGVTYEIGIRAVGSIDFRLVYDTVSGTGFLVRDAEKLFLVTASHVARGMVYAVALTVGGPNGGPKTYNIVAKLNWRHHLREDVAIARLEESSPLYGELLNNALDIKMILREEGAPAPELPLVVIGFPLNLGVKNKFSPLRRETHAASGIIDLTRPDTGQDASFFMIQDPSIGGYSGAPVFATESYRFGNTLMPGLDLNGCVGLIHGTMSDETGGKLGAVTPASAIYELIHAAIAP